MNRRCSGWLLGVAITSVIAIPGFAQDGNRDANSRPGDFLTIRLPRTKGLLNHLKTEAPELHARLLAHSKRMEEAASRKAMKFARTHHPELASLLDDMGQRNPKAWRDAARDLGRDAARLERLKTIDAEEHRAALQAWEAQSRVRLLAARLSRKDDPKIRARLAAEIRKKHEARRAQLVRQMVRRKKASERMETRLARDPEQAIVRELEQVERRAARRRLNSRRRKQGGK